MFLLALSHWKLVEEPAAASCLHGPPCSRRQRHRRHPANYIAIAALVAPFIAHFSVVHRPGGSDVLLAYALLGTWSSRIENNSWRRAIPSLLGRGVKPSSLSAGVLRSARSSIVASLRGALNFQLELYMILAAVTAFADDFRDKRGVWFVDNIAALMALVRGRGNSESLDQMALRIHAALFSIRAWVYFEWVSSESNWADGISRDGLADPWQQRHRFEPGRCVGVPMLLRLPVRAAVTVFEHL